MSYRKFVLSADVAPPLDQPAHRVPRDMGGSGGGSAQTIPTNTTQTVKSEPWEGVQPYLTDIFGRAQTQSNKPGLAPQSPWTTAALSQLYSRGANGSPLQTGAQGSVQSILNGTIPDIRQNPSWAPLSQAITDAYSRGTAAQTDSAFNRAGAFGGSAYQEQTKANQEGLGRSLDTLAGGLTQQTTGNALTAAGLTPGLAGLDYANIQAQQQAGSFADDYAQRTLDNPWTQLQRYQQLVSGQPGGTQNSSGTGTSPYFTNPLANALGLGLGGLGLYNGANAAGLFGSSLPATSFGMGNAGMFATAPEVASFGIPEWAGLMAF